MPYRNDDEVPAFVKRRGGKAAKQWRAIWNSTFSTTGSETDAYKAANGALNLSADEMRGDPVTCIVSSVFPDWDAAGVYEVQVIRTGVWKGRSTGDIEVTADDLADAVRNFRVSSNKPFMDYNHAITDREAKPGDQEAIGWMSEMWIEDLVGNRLEPDEARKSSEKVLVLKAHYEVNADANEKFASKAYAFFSPTWFTEYVNEETGEFQGMTIIGGAATNIPFITGMQGFVAIAASRDAAIRMATMLPKASMTVVADAGMDTLAAVGALDVLGYTVDSWEYGSYRIRAKEESDLPKSVAALQAAGFTVTCFWQGWLENEKKGAADVPATKPVEMEKGVDDVPQKKLAQFGIEGSGNRSPIGRAELTFKEVK